MTIAPKTKAHNPKGHGKYRKPMINKQNLRTKAVKKLILPAFFLCALSLGGCGMVQEIIFEKAIEAGSGEKVDIDMSKESVDIKTNEGNLSVSSGDNVKLPDTFPKDIYFDKNAEIRMAMDLPEGVSVTFVTNESVAAVKDKYTAEMAKNGWTQEMTMDVNGQSMFGFQKQERASQIMIYADQDQTLVQVIAKK
ncbi:hypothetical protein [Picosynechococcus sp. PCC 7002]|uniref:hypothetical protein n=1 Tax=Picosynechococcus sp. (strain ATCC 27264 / PCC 7002 / PR-6) TaxID=32049 RepID=UPI00031FDACA|nr:hypothetical protein [Picosynechococcus sp. PCC 7002]